MNEKAVKPYYFLSTVVAIFIVMLSWIYAIGLREINSGKSNGIAPADGVRGGIDSQKIAGCGI